MWKTLDKQMDNLNISYDLIIKHLAFFYVKKLFSSTKTALNLPGVQLLEITPQSIESRHETRKLFLVLNY